MKHYQLKCLLTGERFDDDGLMLANPKAGSPAFLRTHYSTSSFAPGPHDDGIYRFKEWLPIDRTLEGSSAPITYRSKGLADELGLSRLFVTFSGYWPERGALMLTGTFKECEAYSVGSRLPKNHPQTLVVASAGNTARAFMRVCSDNEIPLVVVVPEKNLPSIWTIGAVGGSVRVVSVGDGADYSDAIAVASAIAALPGFVAEGGAKNVARRDGMATTVLSAIDVIGELPHHYFQAVGSGTGAIAAWEAATRIAALSGYLDSKPMRIRVSQNAPFVPIHNAWKARRRELPAIDETIAKQQIDAINAKVLANRNPPYSIVGGLYDALADSGGDTSAISNGQAAAAAQLFARREGIDVSPAAAVAVAGLIAASRSGQINADEIVMLNVTGGGLTRIDAELDRRQAVPDLTVSPADIDTIEAMVRPLV